MLKKLSVSTAGKRLLPLLIAMVLLIGLPCATAANAIDTASDWARDAINTATEHGYVPHDIQSNYKDVITRAEFCRMAVQYIEYATGRKIDAIMADKGVTRDPNAFVDTDDSAILAAYALGITNGTDTAKRLFTPNGQFSREQAATMLMNTCRAMGADVSNPTVAGFTDMNSASPWAVDGINFCFNHGIMNGTSTNPLRFSPGATYTREQSIMTFDNIDRSSVVAQMNSVIAPGVDNTQAWAASNWAGVSSVQQFAYRDEGLAYAYAVDDALKIKTPTGALDIAMKYPLLGDVNSDDDGNFYVVWGRVGESDTEQTVFISKYAATGDHVKTTGFVGESRMGTSGNTKEPFRAGTCASAIGGGYLMVNYARGMYNGHQSNSVIGVTLSDMSPVAWNSIWEIPYTSHSFNQSVIWSEHANGFVYADQGDAYSRGFTVTTDAGERTLFHFYLEANANYNMWIVNETFAQLGGLAETSSGVVLAGASAKSIGEAAKEERQNLFVQIFDPLADDLSASMFVGGTARSGATSFDINDNSNAPLTPVTDHGVHWLTNYTDRDVVAPQVVAADDKIVVLWSTEDGNWETDEDTYYMVLSERGEVLIPATALGGIPLNSFERPVYHDGAIYWAAVTDVRLTINSIALP